MADLWSQTTGDAAVCIALLDGPVDASHESLADARLDHVSDTLLSPSTGEGLARSHGTHIASMLLGRHGSEVSGIAPGCRGLVVPIFRDAGGQVSVVSQLDLSRAILYALDRGAHVINISGGQPDPSGEAHPLLAAAVRECEANGTLIVAASGNEGCDCLHVPAALESVLVAGATDFEGRLLSSTNWGEQYSTHGVLAPGESVLGAKVGGGIAAGTGTSYAAAVVSGVAALLMSLQLTRSPRLSAHDVKDAIVRGADGHEGGAHAEPGERWRPGRLDIVGARALLSEGVEAVDDPVEATGLEPSDTAPPQPHRDLPEQDLAPTVPAAGTLDDVLASGHVATGSREEVAGAGAGIALMVDARPPDRSSAGECADCGDNGLATTGSQSQLVYAIGQPGYDLVSDARRSSLSQHMPADRFADNASELLEYLDDSPWESGAVNWTLNLDATPIYAIRPEGAFARDGYDRLRQVVRDYMDGAIERISVAGVIVGQTQLISGQIVPVVRPDLRCFYSWTTNALVESIAGSAPADSASKRDRDAYAERSGAVRNFLERVYEDVRNLGLLPQHRALNYAATNALNAARVFDSALREQMQLDTVDVERSPICPPGEDCWDVRLTYFNPARQLEQARRVYKFTISVKEACPVMIGGVRSWYVR
jgi:cyanobactin maturation PatA/PatG family protease